MMLDSNRRPLDHRRVVRLAVFLMALLASVLVGCGGGGSDVAGVDSGGTGSFAVGPISGFGSVIVNEIRYDDSRATVLDDDGAARSPQDLRLGMVVEVEGSALSPAPAGAAFARQGDASVIRFGPAIVGPLQAVDPAVSRIAVFGQVIDVTPTTVFGDGLSGGLATLATLLQGTVLEVHGYLNATGDPAGGAGRYTATRIDRRDAATVFRLHGVVRDVDVPARRFRIGTTVIDYSAIDAGQAAAAGIANGATVRVRLGTVPRGDGAWPMLQARAEARVLSDRDDVDIEGLVTAFESPTAFSVSGIPVDASRAEFDDDSRRRIALGARVEVEGRLRGGVLIADEVEVEDDGSPGGSSDDVTGSRRISLSGRIEALDTTNRTFLLRGVTVRYANAGFDDGNAADLRVGVRVEVDGRLSADGSSVDATEVEFD